MDAIELKLRDIMKDMKPALDNEFGVEDNFKDNVGLDSLDLTEYVARIENVFQIEIEDKDWKQLINIKACMEYVQKKSNKHAAA